MNYRRWASIAEWSLLAIVVAMHAALLFFREPAEIVSPLLAVIVDAQSIVIVVLMGAWFGLGPGRPAIRIVPAGILAAFLFEWSMFSEWSFPSPLPAETALSWPQTLALTTLALVLVVRSLGQRVIRLPVGQTERRPQFSIRSLLIATTLVAVTIGCLELLRPRVITVSSDTPYSDLILQIEQLRESNATFQIEVVSGLIPGPASTRQWILGLAVAGNALGAIWTILRPGPVWLRLGVLVIGLPTLAVYLTHLAGATGQTLQDRALELAVALGTVAGLSAITVLPLRLMGHRLCRPALSCLTLRVGQASGQLMPPPTAFSSQSSSPPPSAHSACGPTLP